MPAAYASGAVRGAGSARRLTVPGADAKAHAALLLARTDAGGRTSGHTGHCPRAASNIAKLNGL